MIARDTLSQPIVSTKLTLEIQKPKFGPVFKKNAKQVQDSLEALNESQIKDFEAKLAQGNGRATITGADGNEYEITSEMVTIAMKTETINGNTIILTESCRIHTKRY